MRSFALRRTRNIRELVLYGVGLAALEFGCTRLPDDELGEAERAILSADSAQAEVYAQPELQQAEAALERAESLVAEKHYREARQNARQARELADLASAKSRLHKERLEEQAQEAAIACERKIGLLRQTIDRADTLGVPDESLLLRRAQLLEMEMKLTRLLLNNAYGEYDSVATRADLINEEASLITYSLLKDIRSQALLRTRTGVAARN